MLGTHNAGEYVISQITSWRELSRGQLPVAAGKKRERWLLPTSGAYCLLPELKGNYKVQTLQLVMNRPISVFLAKRYNRIFQVACRAP